MNEQLYQRMSRDLICKHGPLISADYVSHFPKFEITLTYKDGTRIYSGERTGRYDIHFLSLGYVGEGPRYARHFLAAAGFNLTSEEIEGVMPGDSIQLRAGKATVVRQIERLVEVEGVNTKDNYGNTALWYACKDGDVGQFKALILAGADVNAKSENGNFALIWVAREGHAALVTTLIAAGVDVNERGHNPPNRITTTALSEACSRGHYDCVTNLIAAGADVNAVNNFGECLTPIMRSTRPNILKALIAAGADLNSKDDKGKTALMRASREAKGAVKELIANGTDVNAKSDDGWTALLWAAADGNLDNLKALIAAGADVNVKDRTGMTPLRAG